MTALSDTALPIGDDNGVPRKIAAFTTFHREGYERYGRQMIDAFDRHWPSDIPLRVYYEERPPEPVSDRVECLDLHDASAGLVAFKARHRDNNAARGLEDRGPLRLNARTALGNLVSLLEPLRGRALRSGNALSTAPKRKGIGYRWDAIRFSHKTYCVFHAAETLSADAIFWIDADTVCFRDIPRDFIESTLPSAAMLSFLGRRYRTSECGYVGYNLRHPRIHNFLSSWRELYDTDALFELEEWHDSWVFDWLRKRFERQGVITHDLSQGLGRRAVNHPFVNGPLGAYMDHLKGERKQHGRSLASDLLVSRKESYWRESSD